MDTSRPTLADETAPATRRRQLAVWLRTLATRPRPAWLRVPAWAREPGNWITALIVAVAGGVALALLVAVVWLIVTIITAIGDGLESAGDGILDGLAWAGDGITSLGAWIAHGPITTSVTDPLRAYLDQHATGLPATGGDLWILWLATAGLLFAAAFYGSTYGRIGWVVLGVLTAAAAWHGTALAASRPTAAGVTAALWLVLSLFAYTRRRTRTVDWANVERRMHSTRTCRSRSRERVHVCVSFEHAG